MNEEVKTQEQINEEIAAEMVVVRHNNKEAIIDGAIFMAILFNVMTVLKYFVFPLLFV